MEEQKEKPVKAKSSTNKSATPAEGTVTPKAKSSKAVAAKEPKAATAKKPSKVEGASVPAAKAKTTKTSKEKAETTVTSVEPVAKKPAAKKAAVPKAEVADAPKPRLKKAVVAEIAQPIEAKATKKGAKTTTVAETRVPTPVAKAEAKNQASPTTEETSKKPKGKKPNAEPAVAEEVVDAPSKKERTKPRRRELKRLGLLKPKQSKKHQRALELARKQTKEAAKPQEKAKPKGSEDAPVARKESVDSKAFTGPKPGKKPQAKQMPEVFGAFKKQPNEKAERKKDRKLEKMLKEERQYDQSQGLFEEPIRLNRFVALSGICSRRDADALIADGKVKVNGKVVKEMGFKVQPGKDKIVYKDNELRIKVFVYLLMNKPKNRITTTDDDLGRDTVMEIAERYTKARVYPVGRLDRNTTGLLLLTNDGDLTQKLTHPSSKFPKVYQVRLDKDITEVDLQALRKGFELEDGFIKADKADLSSEVALNEISIKIHSGANHIVKRMMEHLGYEVVALDRVQFGPLTKRGLSRGTCRLLTEKEVGFLKML